MSDPRKGIRIALSPARRIVVELLHHARSVPSLPLKRPLNLARLMAARANCPNKPSWLAMFLKAHALVAQCRPELRRSYIPLPWPHLYEHPTSECAVLVERDWDGEKAVLAAKIRAPEHKSLAEIDGMIRDFAAKPMREVSDLRQLMRIAKLPALLRRFVFWSTLYLSGFKKSKRFGTFMIGSLGNLGVEQCHPLTPLTTYLSFGPIDAAGNVVALLVYDHRVMDGRTVALALGALEATLNGTILAEVQSRAATPVAA